MADKQFEREIQSSLNKLQATRAQANRIFRAEEPDSKSQIPLSPEEQLKLARANEVYGDPLRKELAKQGIKLRKTY